MSHPAIFHTIGEPLIVLSSVDSTNNYAMAQVREGLAGHGTAYFALEQTAGKGQRGKSWITRPGENIMVSIVIQPVGLQTSQQFLLSMAIALACYDFFKKYAGDETRIKWPNDLYWRDRKAAGILIENRVEGLQGTGNGRQNGGNWSWAVAGMGININQTVFAPGVRNPVSLKQITGKEFAVVELVKELCIAVEDRWQMLMSGKQAEIFRDYHGALYKLNDTVKLKKEDSVFETMVCGVSSTGKLLTKDFMEREFEVGEVEWVF